MHQLQQTLKWLVVLATLTLPNSVLAAPHPQVSAALDWEMPTHSCGNPPKSFTQNKTTNDEQGLNLTVTDVDHYTQKRYDRKMNRWQKCIDRHITILKREFDTLKNSAQHGLNQSQAKIIMGHMKNIQTALMSQDALLP